MHAFILRMLVPRPRQYESSHLLSDAAGSRESRSTYQTRVHASNHLTSAHLLSSHEASSLHCHSWHLKEARPIIHIAMQEVLSLQRCGPEETEYLSIGSERVWASTHWLDVRGINCNVSHPKMQRHMEIRWALLVVMYSLQGKKLIPGIAIQAQIPSNKGKTASYFSPRCLIRSCLNDIASVCDDITCSCTLYAWVIHGAVPLWMT